MYLDLKDAPANTCGTRWAWQSCGTHRDMSEVRWPRVLPGNVQDFHQEVAEVQLPFQSHRLGTESQKTLEFGCSQSQAAQVEQKRARKFLGLLQSSAGMGAVGITQESLSVTICLQRTFCCADFCSCAILRNYHERFYFSQRNPHPRITELPWQHISNSIFLPAILQAPKATFLPRDYSQALLLREFLSQFGFAVVVLILFGIFFFLVWRNPTHFQATEKLPQQFNFSIAV